MDTDSISRRSILAVAATGVAVASAGQAAAQAAAPTFRNLTYEARGPVCFITLNRPTADNVVDLETRNELPLAWEAFRADDALKVAIFTGAGEKAFCGGVEVETYRARAAATYLRRDEGARVYTAKQNKCWKPVIAVVNGFVAGPGLQFLLDADICIAAPEATFFDIHLHRTGAVPVIEPIEMAQRMSHGAVSRMFLLGPHEPITAQHALDLGLISEVAPRNRLMPRALEMARQISQADMRLTMGFIESFYKSRELGVTEAINRGLIIRQMTGYQDAAFKGRALEDLAKPGSKL